MNPPVGINEQARRQFELSWQRGEPANIAEFLPAAGDVSYAATLEELVHIDIEFRGFQQQKKPGGGYAGRVFYFLSELTISSMRLGC